MLVTNAFWQNFTINMIQMTAAFSSIINGGNYYEPHMVKQITKENGEVIINYSRALVKETVTKEIMITTVIIKRRKKKEERK